MTLNPRVCDFIESRWKKNQEGDFQSVCLLNYSHVLIQRGGGALMAGLYGGRASNSVFTTGRMCCSKPFVAAMIERGK